jgi:hypothetical protein
MLDENIVEEVFVFAATVDFSADCPKDEER